MLIHLLLMSFLLRVHPKTDFSVVFRFVCLFLVLSDPNQSSVLSLVAIQ